MFNLLITLIVVIRKTCLIFFTGGSNFMPKHLYSSFLSTLENKFDIYKLDIGSNYDSEINYLASKYNKINLIGHSSGCVTAINSCNRNVNRLILLDPVQTPTFKYKDINFLEKVIIINAEKSYKWSILPPFFPFIPFLSIRESNLNLKNDKIVKTEIREFGHCDIINYPWNNFMHYIRISVGNYNRSDNVMKKYHNQIYKIILSKDFNFLENEIYIDF